MDTAISIEYGLELNSRLTIHEGMLRCHSKKFEKLFVQAKHIREQFAQTTLLKDQVARFVYPEVTEREFEERSLDKQVRRTNHGQ